MAEQAKALLDLAPDLIGGVGLNASLPVPHTVEPMLRSGRVTWRDSSREPPGGPPPLYHVMSPFEADLEIEDVWPFWSRGSRLVVTLYDLIPLIMRDQYVSDWGYWATAWIARLGLMRSAHQVLAISQQTAEDAMKHLQVPEERITVIDSGVSDHHSSLVSTRAEADGLLRQELPKVRPGFLLYVGGTDFRKNLEGTIRAYAELPPRLRKAHQLVIACNLGYFHRRNLKAFAGELGIEAGNVLLTGFVPDKVLAALYRSCALFVFPSLYEGAGLPILEAMSCGAPVAASGTSAMPELLGDMEATFDPADPSDMARTIRGVLENGSALDALRARSRDRSAIYTWERVAKRTIEGYERAFETPIRNGSRNGIRGRAPKNRPLAVVTPLARPGSDAATHSRRLIEALSAHLEIDVFAPEDESRLQPDPGFGRAVTVHGFEQFSWRRELLGYDRCLCVLGASADHLNALEAARVEPGVVLAHDVRLLELYRSEARQHFPHEPDRLEGKLLEMYGDRMPHDALKRVPFEKLESGLVPTMTREIQINAQQLLVHSVHQAELLRLERPHDSVRTQLVPYGIPSLGLAGNGSRAAQDPLVIANGVGRSWPKLLEAFAQLRETQPGARLIVLDELDRATRESVGEIAGRRGIAAAVELAGRADVQRYREALASADLALQLQEGADGGRVSGEVCDFIAARIPTVVYNAGWRAELPAGVVIPIDETCSAVTLSGRLEAALRDDELRRESREAQEAYAEENTFERVAERYAELLWA